MMDGFTLYFCFGPYAGFHVMRDGKVLRFILGWLSIGLCAFDLELYMEDASRITGALIDRINDKE